jgi:spore maturation protein CgeB
VSAPFDLVVLGLTVSSSWGNGHATTFRALLRAYEARGHRILFLERDKPWYAAHRDLSSPSFCELRFYDSLDALSSFADIVANADAIMVGSYVPDGIEVGRFVQKTARGVTAFYDIDTPITLAALDTGDCAYLSRENVRGFDAYLSFTGGPTLHRLETQYGARLARPLYCSVDPNFYAPLDIEPRYDLGYLGTYSDDRQPALERLLLDVARARPDWHFAVAGPQYPREIDWPANVERIEHLPPAEHGRFYASCRWTLNVTRADMIRAGWSPSVRLFEAAACGTPIISDEWNGIADFLEPGRDIALARTTKDVIAWLETSEEDRRAMAARAREKVLANHTAAHRAAELEQVIEAASCRRKERSA